MKSLQYLKRGGKYWGLSSLQISIKTYVTINKNREEVHLKNDIYFH